MIRLGGTKMSKSKGNLITPAQFFDTVGADALRLHHLFMGPPADDVDWTDAGIKGTSNFLQRLWRGGVPESDAGAAADESSALEINRAAHRLLVRVSDAY